MNVNMIKCSHIKRRSKFDPTRLFTQRLNVNENEPENKIEFNKFKIYYINQELKKENLKTIFYSYWKIKCVVYR